MAIKLKNWFFEATKTAVKRGTRFLTGDRPEEQTFRNLLDSAVIKAEQDDRAKEDDSSAALSGLTGHVVASTDEQAKAKQTKKTDRTLVTQPSQLPEVIEDTEVTLQEDVDIYTGKILDVVDDPTVLTRSSYKITMQAAFITWFNAQLAKITALTTSNDSLTNQVEANTIQVGKNTSDIFSLSSGTLQGGVPLGTVVPTAATAAPAGWRMLDTDVEVDNVEYATLLSIVTTYGAGNAPGTTLIWKSAFNGAVLGNASGTSDGAGALRTSDGSTVITDKDTLSKNQIPDHIHDIPESTLSAVVGLESGDAIGRYGLVDTNSSGSVSKCGSIIADDAGLSPNVITTPQKPKVTVSGNTVGITGHSGIQEQYDKTQKTFNMRWMMFVGDPA